jgi:hypothetical protein
MVCMHRPDVTGSLAQNCCRAHSLCEYQTVTSQVDIVVSAIRAISVRSYQEELSRLFQMRHFATPVSAPFLRSGLPHGQVDNSGK